MLFIHLNNLDAIISTMTFGYIFARTLEEDTETCYRLTLKDQEHLGRVKGLTHFFKNRMDNTIEVSTDSFLGGVDSLIHIIGPLGQFMTSEAEVLLDLLNKAGYSWITEVIIFKRSFSIINYEPLLECEYFSLDEIKTVEGNPNHEVNPVISIDEYLEKNNTVLTKELIEYYTEKFPSLNTLELFDLLQGNSEHARHHVFNAKWVINDFEDPYSLIDKIKSTNTYTIDNESLIAFRDNASSIIGFKNMKLLDKLVDYSANEVYFKTDLKTGWYHLTSNAETHNFPTSICPFPGAATGTGGRIRDTVSIGQGGEILSGFCGYYVGDTECTDQSQYPYKLPIDTLILASNGCSDYGNKIGEPVLGGFTRDFKLKYKDERFEYVKPVLYSAGNGLIWDNSMYKTEFTKENLEKQSDKVYVLRVGGKAYKIGLGGGSCSSRDQSETNKNQDLVAVQRGNPEMENRVIRFVEKCSELGLILSIHDQGSGGMANVTKEIVTPCGADIYLSEVSLGDKSMNDFEIWNSEYQEQVSVLVSARNLESCTLIAERENVPLDCVGCLNNSGSIRVFSKETKKEESEGEIVLNFNLNDIEELPKQVINVKKEEITTEIIHLTQDVFDFVPIEPLEDLIKRIFTDVSVSSKRYLVHKVDRSVGGLVAQQQCIGPWNMPLADYSISHINFFGYNGIATSFGERPILGLLNINSMITMSVGEMLTNLIFSGAEYNSIKCQGNWMWSVNHKNYNFLLYAAVEKLRRTLGTLGIGIDGGKDSLSMNIKYNDQKIISPNSFVIKSYAKVVDTKIAVQPYFKGPNHDIIYINLGKQSRRRMGGSVYFTKYDNISNDKPPEFDNKVIEVFKNFWDTIQGEMRNGNIYSGHDVSDGGLITSLIEMSIASFYGMTISIQSKIPHQRFLFNEELGIILEFNPKFTENFIEFINSVFPMIFAQRIGVTTFEPRVKVVYNTDFLMSQSNVELSNDWEKSSFKFEKKQMNNELAEDEYASIELRKHYNYTTSFNVAELKRINPSVRKHKAIVIRDIGSNSDKELKAAWFNAGFEVFDFTTDDFITAINSNASIMNAVNVISFCGGFSRSDVMGSAVGWYNLLTNNSTVVNYLKWFYEQETKYSLGICNGCQLMSQLNWIPKCKIVANNSGKFESRFPGMVVGESNSAFTKDLNGTFFGMNSAHGEGKIVLDELEDREYIKRIFKNNVPFFYADYDAIPTENYPFNPNGSKYGIAALCSNNGNHMAIMPHPERTFLISQCQYKPEPFNDLHYTPWFKIFVNIYNKLDEYK